MKHFLIVVDMQKDFVSNALLLKAHFPEIPVAVDATCCAGVTPATHQAALDTMRMCQITVQE